MIFKYVIMLYLIYSNLKKYPLCSFSDKIKCIIVDFECTMINEVDLLLTSGTITNSLDKYQPVKLQGRPLVLTTQNKLQVFLRKDK